MVDRLGNNVGRLGAGFISVCIEIRWLGHFGGFYVPEPYCMFDDAAARPPQFCPRVERNPTELFFLDCV